MVHYSIKLIDRLESYRRSIASPWPLSKQIAIALGVVILIVGSSAGKLVRYLQIHHLRSTMETHASQTAMLLSAVSVDAVISQDIPLLETIVNQAILKDLSIVALKIKNLDNQILIDWQHPTNSNLLNRLSFSKKITYKEEIFGELSITWDMTQTYQEIESRVHIMQGLTISVLVFLTSLILGLVHHLVLYPVSKIDRRLFQLIHGDLSDSLALPPYVAKELRQLGNLTNVLGESIFTQRQTEEILRQNEEQLKQKTQQLEEAIGEIKKTQAQLIHNEKLSGLGQLVAGIAHEINNPVTFISGNLVYVREYVEDLLEIINLYQTQFPNPNAELQELIEDKEVDFLLEDIFKMLNSIENGANRIQGIVLSLRSFSRLDESELKTVDIHVGIESTLMLLQSRLRFRANRSEIIVIKEYGELPKITCYAGQLNQVFLNIISNAIDALESYSLINKVIDKIQITITTKVIDNQRISICIKDNGPGISLEVQQKLFDPFFTTKPVGKGTGMGLAISHQVVVETHKGELQCVSKPDRGTEFWIKIPFHP